MAKRFGPYSQYAISEDGRFFGFNENDDNLLRYKMSSEVAEAIQESFTLIKDDTSPILVSKYWPAAAQSTIEYYREMFKNAEVIPYVYYLEEQRVAKAPSNAVPQNFVVNSACISNENLTVGNTKKMCFSADFENSDDVLAFTAFNNLLTNYNSSYYHGGSNNLKILKLCKLATKQEHSSIVSKPIFYNFDNFSPDMSLNWKNYKSKDSLFNTSGSIVDPFDTDSVYTTSQLKTKFPGMKTILRFETYDNSNDGTYTEENQRSEAGVLYSHEVQNESDLNPFDNIDNNNRGINSFVFFVKTFANWYDETTGEIDESRESVQYWCFNIMSLFAQRWFDGQYSFTWSIAKSVDSYNYLKRNNYKDNFCIGLGLQAKTGNLYGPIQQSFYIPFTYFIKNNTRFFDSSIVIGNYSNASFGDANTDWTFEVATQNGSSIGFFDELEMLDFLVNGLGLPMTFDDSELKYKSTKDWERDFPNADVPGAGGQVGGLTGGGQGSGIGETFDNVGTASSSTRGTYTQSSYILNETNMKHLQEAMVNDSLWTAITNMFKNNPQDGVINLIRFPINFDNIVSINNEDVHILGVNVSEMGESGYVRGTKIPNGILTSFDLGSFDFPERFGTFLDFEPYTKTTLFLPFLGFKQISTDAIVGRRIRIHYDVDYSDGSALCVVRVSNKRTTGTDFSTIESMGYTPLYTFEGQIGQMIPLTQNNAQQKNQSLIKNALTATASIGVGIATGGMGAAAAAVGVSSAMMNAANTILDKTQHNSGGTISSQQAYAINDLTPFVIIDFPEVNIPNGFQKYSGYITNLYQRMDSVSGFTQFDNVRITGIHCTSDEEKELVNLLESGVIINE